MFKWILHNNYSQRFTLLRTKPRSYISAESLESVEFVELADENSSDIFRRNGLIGGSATSAFPTYLPHNRKFPGKRNFPPRPFPRSFPPRFSVIYSVQTKSNSVGPLTRARRTRYIQQLMGSAFSCIPVLPSHGLVISYILLLRLRSLSLNFRLAMSLPDCSTLFSFARSICVKSRLFFRFTRTRRCDVRLSLIPYRSFTLLSTRTVQCFSSSSCVSLPFSRLYVFSCLFG